MAVQRTGASRHAEWRCGGPGWLAPVADLAVRHHMNEAAQRKGRRRFLEIAVLNALLVLLEPLMGRSKNFPWCIEHLWGFGLCVAMIVVAVTASIKGDWIDRLIAAGFCALPIAVLLEMFRYGLPQ